MTCSGSSLNCTSCDGRFKFNWTCVAQCPDNYYALNDECFACSPNVESCNTPLNFNVSTTVQDYQQVVVIKFNQRVKVNDTNLKTVLKLKLKVQRRLLDFSSLINSGVDYEYEILEDGTIRLILQPGMSIDDAEY